MFSIFDAITLQYRHKMSIQIQYKTYVLLNLLYRHKNIASFYLIKIIKNTYIYYRLFYPYAYTRLNEKVTNTFKSIKKNIKSSQHNE